MTPGRIRNLCRRRGCCPEIAFAADPEAPYAAVLAERGGGARTAAAISLTREELLELARALDEEGWVERARAEGRARPPGAGPSSDRDDPSEASEASHP